MLELRDYKIIYENKTINFPDILISENEFVGIRGNSGCGKTSLLNSVFGYDFDGKIEASKMVLQGKNVKSMGKEKYQIISYCPQFAQEALNPKLSVREHIDLVLVNNHIPIEKQELACLLEQLRLSKCILELYPYMLSGGQKQRLVLLLCYIKKPKLLVLDEPSSAIDLITLKIIVEFLESLKGKITIILVSHNQDFLKKLCHRIIQL